MNRAIYLVAAIIGIIILIIIAINYQISLLSPSSSTNTPTQSTTTSSSPTPRFSCKNVTIVEATIIYQQGAWKIVATIKNNYIHPIIIRELKVPDINTSHILNISLNPGAAYTMKIPLSTAPSNETNSMQIIIIYSCDDKNYQIIYNANIIRT